MKDKLVVNDDGVTFELNLANLRIVYQEESNRYKDEFTTKFSFPFEFHLNRDLRVVLGDFSNISAVDLKTVYEDCYHIFEGKIRKSKLEILGSVGEVIKAQIDSGFEEFPNWSKRLRDLPLGIVETPLADAPNVIDKTWPEVAYNYPAIHTDSYEDDSMFEDFEGLYNKREDGSFIINIWVPGENLFYNKNIVLPMPYWLHILKTGFEDAGFSLHGDVLSNEQLKKTIVVPGRKIEIFDRPGNIEWFVGLESGTPNGPLTLYEDTQPIDHIGQFIATGLVKIRNKAGFPTYTIPTEFRPKIWLNDQLIWSSNEQHANVPFAFIFQTASGIANELKFRELSGPLAMDEFALYMKIVPVIIFDENGEPTQSLANLTDFNIAEYLPDKTFGEFVTATKNLCNLEMDLINGTEVWLNYIDRAFDDNTLIDISRVEVKNPERIFPQNLSFLLTYKEIDDENYKFPPVFFDEKGMQTEDYVEPDDINRIEIPALPLPLKLKDGIRTAHQFLNDDDVFQMVIYDGLNDGENTTDDPAPWAMSVVFSEYWLRWLSFRLNASGLKWSFSIKKNLWKHVKLSDKLYAYGQKLWIKNITKTSLNDRVYEIEIEIDIVKN